MNSGKFKWPIIIITALLTAGSILFISKLSINSDIESYLPDEISSKINNDSIESVFGVREPILLVFECEDILNTESLKRIKNISDAFSQTEEIDRVISIFETKLIKGSAGSMVVEDLIEIIPQNTQEKSDLRRRIKENEHVYGQMVSENFKYTFILINVNSNSDDKTILNLISDTLGKYPSTEKIYLNGPLYMRVEANEKITLDFMVLLPIGLMIMIIFLYFSFRQKRAVILPLAVVAISSLISLALLQLFGWQLSIIGILIPVMMIAIANDYGIHFITKYQEISSLHPSLPEKYIVEKTSSYLNKPVFLTGLTTMIGLLGLVLHIMLPAKQMGIISTIGIGSALVLSLIFIPAMLTVFNKPGSKNSYTRHKNNYVIRLLSAISKSIVLYPRVIIFSFVLILCLTATGLNHFRIASDFDDILHENHPYTVALKLANKQLGGTKNISLLFEGDILDPQLLHNMDHYEKELEKMAEISSANSIATMIREMSMALYQPYDPEYGLIPKDRTTIAQFLELYNMSGDPQDLEDFVDFAYEHALMEIQFRSKDKKTIQKIEKRIDELTKNDPFYSLKGGYVLVEKQLSDAIAIGQIYSLIFALVAIIFLLAIVFKSLMAGLLGGLPLLISILCTFGIMGWLGIQLNIVTALLSSISIGLGVDYTIHILWRIKKEIAAGNDLFNAIQKSIKTSGYGITINALSVIIGFSVLLFSSFGIIQSFGFLIILSILICLLCSMILIPSLCYLLRPKFLFR